MDGQIVRQSSSYRQGLVLGLTMAEILILLVFCLLIALTAFLQVEQKKRKDVEHQLGVERAQNAAYRTAAAAADPGINEHWRELVEGRSFLMELKDRGLSPGDVRSQLAENQKLRSKGIDVDDAIRDRDTLAAVKKTMPGTLDSSLAQTIASRLTKDAQSANPAGHRWPPIITLSDDDYRFPSGSAALSSGFRQSLSDKVAVDILARIKEFDVDVIEVVGHTDEQPIGSKQSNLDRELISVLRNTTDVSRLTSADNAGLGLSRAVAVASVLRSHKSLTPYKVIPMSAAQLIKNDETLATDSTAANDPERRRIEIRLRKSQPREALVREATVPAPVPTPKARPQRPAQRSNSIEVRPLGPPLSIGPQPRVSGGI